MFGNRTISSGLCEAGTPAEPQMGLGDSSERALSLLLCCWMSKDAPTHVLVQFCLTNKIFFWVVHQAEKIALICLKFVFTYDRFPLYELVSTTLTCGRPFWV